MKSKKVSFPNANGELLDARLSQPDHSDPVAYVLFAHCFTCGKDIRAASRISQTLVANGFAVLRFDFTGLGGSQGDFANTNFSSNIEDLIKAADFLRAEHRPPSVLIGHSLGGTAVLAAASAVPECRAVVTIGSPATATHLLRHVPDAVKNTTDEEDITVSIAGRDVSLKKQFLEDLTEDVVTDRIRQLRRALLILHSPLDNIVSIDEAGAIFQNAKHPKSFVTLDGADHLLSRTEDAQYVATVISAWLKRYLDSDKGEVKSEISVPGGAVWVGEANKKFLRQVKTDDHAWVADEPTTVGGENLGPDPYELLLSALGTCTSMTIRMYANRKQIPLEDVTVELTHSRTHQKDCEDCEGEGKRIDVLSRTVSFKGDLTEAQTTRLLEIADRCPVHRTLEGELRIETSLLRG